ncbi:MAG: DHH family phosphoesterase [Clostridium sp.]|nr:DHH family phosphoesterase [Clostridium sp.]
MQKYYQFRKSDYLYSFMIVMAILFLYLGEQWIVATMLALIFLGILFYLNSLYTYKKKRWDVFTLNVISKISKSAIKSLEDVTFPLVLIREEGEIVWYNKKALDLFSNKQHNFKVDDILPDYKEQILTMETSQTLDVKILKKEYQMIIIPVEHQEKEFHEHLRILAFNDVSLVKEAEEKLVSIMSIEVDNYSDLISDISAEKKPFLLAEIENFIYSYGHEVHAMVNKYEYNKFMMVIPEYNLDQEVKKKFPLLDEIKNISQGNTIEPTLSIGIGRGGETPEENQALSKTAKELALGRGGDQVVIKTPTELSFFGGSSKEIEKKSRVRSRVIAHTLKDMIEESGEIFIMGHRNPDMDCFGAAIGIKVMARGLHKKARIILEEPYTNILPMYKKIMEVHEYQKDIISLKKAYNLIDENDMLIIVDVHARNYVLDAEIIKKFKKVVIIDHHRRVPDQITGAVLSYIEPYASSASELVTEMMQYVFDKPELSILEAEALFAGISVDTKSFNFKTGVRTFEAASFLKRQGARTVEIREMFASDLDSFKKKGEIIRGAEIIDKIAISKVYEISDPLLSAQAADDLANFKEINAAFVLTKQDNDIIINGRSHKDINVQVVLEELGGGGHMSMAGARLENATMESALEKLMTAIYKHKKEEKNNESNIN